MAEHRELRRKPDKNGHGRERFMPCCAPVPSLFRSNRNQAPFLGQRLILDVFFRPVPPTSALLSPFSALP